MDLAAGNSIAVGTHMQNICICYHGEPSSRIFDIEKKMHITDDGHNSIKEQITMNGERVERFC